MRANLSPQDLQQLLLHRNLRFVVLQGCTVQKEAVFHALAQGGDFGEQRVDLVAGQHKGDYLHAQRTYGLPPRGAVVQHATRRFANIPRRSAPWARCITRVPIRFITVIVYPHRGDADRGALGACNNRVLNWPLTGANSPLKPLAMTISAAQSGNSTEKISAFSVGSAV